MTLQQPHPYRRQSRRLSTCHRHPTTAPATAFCASCLRERLASIQNDSSSLTTRTPTSSTSQLRRSKSFSGGPDPSSSSASEPHRKSCDVMPHSTLHHLLAVNDEIKTLNVNNPPLKIEAFQSFEEEEEDEGELKTMKEFIDLECRTKKHSGKSLWDAASVFSKKLKKWRNKQNKTERKEGFVLEKENRKGFRDTQSEIGEYGLFGRRTCDIDPRLSVDFGCLSVDEPRASWDGCLIGKQKPKVNEEPKPKPSVWEDRLSVVKEEERVSPGGLAQTRDYYGESLTRRRSFDRSGSNRKVSFGEAEEFRSSISNAKVSPETVGLFHGAKLLVTEKELRDSNWYSHVESGSKDVELVGNEEVNLKKAKSWKNVWSIWSLIPRRKQSEFGDEDRNVRGDLGNVRLAESLQKPRRVANGDDNKGIGGNVGEGILADSLQKLTRFANGDESKGIGGNVADATLAESLLKLRRVVNGVRDSNEDVVRQKLLRSYSVSAQNSVDGPSLYGTSVTQNSVDGSSLYGTSVTRNSVDGSALYGMHVTRNSVDGSSLYGTSVTRNSVNGSSLYGTSVTDSKSDRTKRRDNQMLQPNMSVRYSPNNLDNGILRFYLTPLRSYRRSKSGKSRLRNSNSVPGSIF